MKDAVLVRSSNAAGCGAGPRGKGNSGKRGKNRKTGGTFVSKPLKATTRSCNTYFHGIKTRLKLLIQNKPRTQLCELGSSREERIWKRLKCRPHFLKSIFKRFEVILFVYELKIHYANICS